MQLGECDPSWPERLHILAERVRATLGELVVNIEHVGSTAVRGLAAPVIDLDVVVRPENLPCAIERRASVGYVRVGDLGSNGHPAGGSGGREPDESCRAARGACHGNRVRADAR